MLTHVQSHHHVLPSWAAYRATLDCAPRLITLDHHTDTASPFERFMKLNGITQNCDQICTQMIAQIDFRNMASVHEAVNHLSNDEHIVAAIRSDLISSAFVIAHNAQDTNQEIYRNHKIMCRAVDRAPGSKRATRADCDKVLEAKFLNEMIASFDQSLHEVGEASLESRPYILDVDLDYLNTHLAVAPQDASAIRRLALNAGLITIATEPDYVKHCALDMGLTSEVLRQAFQDLIEIV